MENEFKSCHFLCKDVVEFSQPAFSLKWILRKKVKPVLSVMLILPIVESVLKRIRNDNFVPDNSKMGNVNEDLNLQSGDWVEVRSINEIYSTLDEKKRYKGLLFMPEMKHFCEKKFRVYKKVEKILLESTGEMRSLRSPTVFLEGVHCDGKLHERCDRSCFLFWREAWLKKTEA